MLFVAECEDISMETRFLLMRVGFFRSAEALSHSKCAETSIFSTSAHCRFPHVVRDDNCGKASMEPHFLQKTQALGRAAWDDKFGEKEVLRFVQDDNFSRTILFCDDRDARFTSARTAF
jgi:hypothetical protein